MALALSASDRQRDRSLLIGLTVTSALAIVVLLLYCFKGAFRRKRRRRFAYPHGNMSSTGLLPLNKSSTTSLLPLHDAKPWKGSLLIGLLGSPTWEAKLTVSDVSNSSQSHKTRSAYSSTAPTSHYSTAKTGTSNNSTATNQSVLTEFGHISGGTSKASTTLRASDTGRGQKNYLGTIACIPDPILDPEFPMSTYQLPMDAQVREKKSSPEGIDVTLRADIRPSVRKQMDKSLSATSPHLSHSSNPFFQGGSTARLTPKLNSEYITSPEPGLPDSKTSKYNTSHRGTHSTNPFISGLPGPVAHSNAVEEAIAFLRSPPRSLSKASFQSPTLTSQFSSLSANTSSTKDTLPPPLPKSIFHSAQDNALPRLPDLPEHAPSAAPIHVPPPAQSKPRATSTRQRSSSVGPSPLRNMTLPESSSKPELALPSSIQAQPNSTQKPYGSVGRGLPSRSNGATAARLDSDFASYRKTSEPRKVSFGEVDPLSAMLRDLAQEASQWDESVYVNDEFRNLMQRTSSAFSGFNVGFQDQHDEETEIDLAEYELEPTYRSMKAIQEDSMEAVSSMPSPERTPSQFREHGIR